jgi:hypothetical protein
MFDSLEALTSKLAATGYFIDPVMTKVVFLAAGLKKLLLLEGPAESGKTQLAPSVAADAGAHVERLQCYRGVSRDKAIGHFDEVLQRLYLEFSKGKQGSWQAVSYGRTVYPFGQGDVVLLPPVLGVCACIAEGAVVLDISVPKGSNA